MLMQNHGFLASINGIVSFAQLYQIPLLMLISYRGSFGERDPWQTAGRQRHRTVLRALGIPYRVSRRSPDTVEEAHSASADARRKQPAARRAAL